MGIREIIFRGKRIDNGEWVEGYLIKGQHYLDEKETTAITPLDLVFYPHCEISGYEIVIPETVGQFTGLTDKNGNKIFEHDIVKVTEKHGQQDESPFIMIGEIVYEDCMFGLKTKDGKFYTPIWENEELEVIGNIFDNKDWSENNDNI